MDNISRIRTIDQWIEMQPDESMKSTNFGSVTLIVEQELIIQKSSIYTGFLYIQCKSLQIDKPSTIISNNHTAMIYVDGKKFKFK